MVSPKNWSKVETTSPEMVHDWTHKSGNASLAIIKKQFGRSAYDYDVVLFWDKPNGGVGRRKLNVGMDRKDEARTFAVNWMRQNPTPKEIR